MADGGAPVEWPCWYFLQDGSDAHRGPVHAAALGDARLVWREGMGEWLPPASVPEVATALMRAARGGGRAGEVAAPRWYYQRLAGSPEGPVGVGDLQAAILGGEIDGMTAVWTEGMAEWLELREVPALRALFVAAQETLRQGEQAEGEDDGGGGASMPPSVDVALRAARAPPSAPPRGAADAPAGAAPDGAAAGAPAAARKRKRPAKRFNANNPNSIYVSQLPPSVSTDAQLALLFEPCGLIKAEHGSSAKKAKLYRDEDGRPKGDGVVTFARKESVELALSLRDGYVLPTEPSSAPLRVQRARFEARGKFAPAQRSKDELDAAKQARAAERKALAQWDDGLGAPARGVRVVIIKGVWSPAEASALPPSELRAWYANLRADLEAECAKCGQIEKVTLFEAHPHAVAAVKFRAAASAEVCQARMHGRRFGERELEAEFFDGVTNYTRAAAARAAGGAAGAANSAGARARGAAAAAAAGGGEEDEAGTSDEGDDDGGAGLDSHTEQQRRLEAMAAQLDAQSSGDEDEPNGVE